MAVLCYHEIFGLLLAAQNNGNVPKIATVTEVSFIDSDEIEMGYSEQMKGENTTHDQEMEEVSSKREQPRKIKRGGKTQKLSSVDIDKQHLDSLT